MIHFDALDWRLGVIAAVFLAAVHAWCKVSPYFAATWFGAGALFGWFWTPHHAAPEALLLPAFVVYLAAAISKGIFERGALAGNHVVHVLATGVFSAVVALPLEAAARSMGWVVPRGAPVILGAAYDGAWFGPVGADLLVQWALLGTLFYGVYKLLDHIGLGPALQTVAIFLAQPLLARLMPEVADWLA